MPVGIPFRPTHKQLIAFFNGWAQGHQIPRSSDAEARFVLIANCNPPIVSLSDNPSVNPTRTQPVINMSISITVQGTDKPSLIAALLVALAALGGTAPAGNSTATAGAGAAGGKAPTEAEKKAAAEKAAKDKKAAEAEAKKKAEAEAAAKKKAAEAGDGEITLESLRELGKAAIKGGKNAEMRALLSKLGSESITALDADKYADFKSGIEAIIAGEEPAATEDDSSAL